MELEHKTRILAGLVFTQQEAHASSTRFGYWEKRRSVEEMIALLHKDVSETFEVAVAGDGPSSHLPDTTRLEEKLADIIIRVMDIGAGLKASVGPAVLHKMEYNERLSKLVKQDY